MPVSYRDPRSIAGKPLAVAETTQLLVVGAGPAGLACAIEGASQGRSVVLVDENPVAYETMGLDVPWHFGGRAGGAARNASAMMEAVVASDPAITEAFDAGVDVRLGTSTWGLYANGPNVGWLPGLVAGLEAGGKSWMLGASSVVVATGRRDMGLAFPGWELPGVMGITAAWQLAHRYGALDARRAVVLGSGAETLHAAACLQAVGVEIVAIVEQASAPLASAATAALLLGHAVVRAEGGPSGVEAIVVRSVERPDGERRIECDTVLLGVGAVPVIELLDALGCRIAFRANRGGHVPVLDDRQMTSVPGVYAAGDCAGVWPEKSLARGIAEAEGRRAAGWAGPIDAPDEAEFDLAAYRLGWVRASVIDAAGAPHVCQCEEVTARDILEVRPPRYLGWPEDRRNARHLSLLLGAGAPNPDQVKRLTRAGMGLCQGRRCREQIAALLALGGGVGLEAIPLASYRAPVRPLKLSVAAAAAEPPGMAEHWDTWFGMVSQYVPFWEAEDAYTAAGADRTGEAASE